MCPFTAFLFLFWALIKLFPWRMPLSMAAVARGLQHAPTAPLLSRHCSLPLPLPSDFLSLTSTLHVSLGESTVSSSMWEFLLWSPCLSFPSCLSLTSIQESFHGRHPVSSLR